MVTTEVILPSVALRPYVHHYWIMKTNDMSLSHIIMPVGNPKLIFHRKRPFDINGVVNINRKASIIGLYDKAKHINSIGRLRDDNGVSNAIRSKDDHRHSML